MELEDKSKTEQIEDKEAQESAMSFWDHLEVLRWALFRSACVLMVILVGTFIAMPYIFDRFVLAPTSNEFFVYQWLNAIGGDVVKLSPDFDVQIININVASQFMTHISTSISMGSYPSAHMFSGTGAENIPPETLPMGVLSVLPSS